ncbi:MAG TPA: bifunctional (p)ppGpp synthetase/guanosine-3',5'-bis(diphosphate) 3'-pyrophosphohydrolase, partial [Gammaproteobacteria bacterium]|nr:bifunctional (p)ppGpp synthetase/guanosine-3',5'-bis(diphosphate) 3'-pyrophosphohydrolase [Gammaproteobacteria bacterium]
MVSSSRLPEPVATGARFLQALSLADRRQEITENFPHGEDVVESLRLISSDEDMLIAAYLADRRFMDTLANEEIETRFGDSVARLVRNVRTLNNLPGCGANDWKSDEQAERLRRLLLALVDDVRAVLIKLAYRLQRLRMLDNADYHDRRCIARETLEIYSPLANRLGASHLKWELEDLAFRYLDPISYKRIARGLEERRADREAYIDQFRHDLEALLKDGGIDASISGRPKHIYSIWKKMQRKGVGLEELFDILALRVIVETLGDCYATLGVVHTHWKTIPREFDDYIANPKPNGYQSLHTVVIGPGGKPVEIQIRTEEMDEFAEQGVAAHWIYKEGKARDDALQHVVNSLRTLLEDGGESNEELLEDFKTEIYANRVFVFTPKGQVIELPRGATPLDFAYAVHTEVGHRCRGAKVDGKIVPLTSKLETGDSVEILTGKEAAPSRNWMDSKSGYLASASARAKVRNWFHRQDSKDN